MFDFKYQLKLLPDKPGVYLMKNSLGEVIYVGKAKILKNRVRQYFQSSKNHSEKVKAMVKNIAEFEYIVTDSEIEALILECNLIKKYKPRYNILLKDDKHYPFIKITTNEDFPRIFVTRIIAKDGAKYFGPYVDVSAVYETMELIKKIFPIRTCKRTIIENGNITRPCLNYHINLCTAPCAGLISKEDYSKTVGEIINVLNGKDSIIIKQLKMDMEKASEEMDFERAAFLRDKIIALNKVSEKQKIMTGSFENEDFINLDSDEKDTCVNIFFVRNGKIVGREHFMLENTSGEDKAIIISQFIKEFYGGTAFIPKNIYVPDILDVELLEQWLTMKRGSKVEIKIPQKGDKKNLLEMVKRNASATLDQFKLKILQDKALHKETLQDLAHILNLEELPNRIEAYDISNIQGVDSVGSMVVFEKGKPKNSDYRRFKIKTVKGANDYDSMREILIRRFKRGLDEVKAIEERNLELSAGKFCIFPDLILMDGGLGQINIALEVLKKLNIDIPVCGMVKDDRHNTRGLIYNSEELFLKKNSNVMHFITRIQDEVHRFAISYHRSLRDKRILHSVLEDIPNIGAKRRKELLKKFGSIDNIKKASYKELLSIDSIDTKAANSILDYFGKASLEK
ncbi:UvrABC system protein C [Clostridium pasteurianum DSM 525 = ATCC 6013]|uniref:UvrABC system protein C n=1 Tax=Clostridium pasteurianum DSM 525 = ATCC 6013 TaxID=1262449 RepID=A0A0H3J6L9_CLOPA|nr:excinuclease ABC subunit UvrC [Clostridium pasteurianum]AJA48842.1 UvrABC system protein C [Clostridium pasteurianum DSM 525 = ATCC 6013]AJA52830.1 UvrABC system protein C [Clostridium pasteurianum DSM 525 = ATCC 6013]AOZ76054.1 excinuclease ABC subunit C [Clostridium pasteurianum DSM 525 = ATCC 6013]AOZ79850.1 excinuclease ABC subunit C [Clostridium pasteurianum]ELP60138.1 excinuclease ABC subunit C [Clostridium pasteurianum DSM 525 = ATCC 6013]